MDVINEQAVYDQIVKPAIDRLEREVVPQVEAALAGQINSATVQLSNIVHGVLLALQATTDKTVADVAALLSAQDGWTLNIGPITIPAITIRLTKP